jgi:hypothetical protein
MDHGRTQAKKKKCSGVAEHAARGDKAWSAGMVPAAAQKARAETKERGLKATFAVGDVLALVEFGRRFDHLIDSGFLHPRITDASPFPTSRA